MSLFMRYFTAASLNADSRLSQTNVFFQ